MRPPVGAFGQVDDVGGQAHVRHVHPPDGGERGRVGRGVERAHLVELLQEAARLAEKAAHAPLLGIDARGVGVAELALLADVRPSDELVTQKGRELHVGDVALARLGGEDAGIGAAEDDGELHPVEPSHPEEVRADLHGLPHASHAAREEVGPQGVGLADAAAEEAGVVVGGEHVVVLTEDEVGRALTSATRPTGRSPPRVRAPP